MHDLDRTVVEFAAQPGEQEFGEYEAEGESFEFGEYEFEGDHPEPGRSQTEAEGEGVLSEQEEMELTMEALGVTNEEEYEYFLGNLVSKIGKGIGKVAPGVLKTLGGALKGIGKTVLPIAATAAGTFFGGPAGGALGGALGSALSKSLEAEAEAEGLSGEDRAYMQAEAFVNFASQTGRILRGAPRRMPPNQAVRMSMLRAMRGRRGRYGGYRRRYAVAPPVDVAPPYDDIDALPDGAYADGVDGGWGEMEATPQHAALHHHPHAHGLLPQGQGGRVSLAHAAAAALPPAHAGATGATGAHATARGVPAPHAAAPRFPAPAPATAPRPTVPSAQAPRFPAPRPSAGAAPALAARQPVQAAAVHPQQALLYAQMAGASQAAIPGQRGQWIRRGSHIYIIGV